MAEADIHTVPKTEQLHAIFSTPFNTGSAILFESNLLL